MPKQGPKLDSERTEDCGVTGNQFKDGMKDNFHERRVWFGLPRRARRKLRRRRDQVQGRGYKPWQMRSGNFANQRWVLVCKVENASQGDNTHLSGGYRIGFLDEATGFGQLSRQEITTSCDTQGKSVILPECQSDRVRSPRSRAKFPIALPRRRP